MHVIPTHAIRLRPALLLVTGMLAAAPALAQHVADSAFAPSIALLAGLLPDRATSSR